MNARRRSISLGFTSEKFSAGLHICYIFNDENERRRVMARYLEAGLRDGEKVLYLVDTMTPRELLDTMQGLGVDLRAKEGDLTVAAAAPAYCPSGHFSADETLGLIRKFHDEAIEQGYSGARGTGEMSWCLREGLANREDLMGYEARLNLLIAEVPFTACCQYDAARFDGGTLMDVLNVHPLMIVRGQLVRNPMYTEPALFLEELRSRRARAHAV